MSAQRAESSFGALGSPESLTSHDNRTAVEGLEDLFKWASEMVADGEDNRVRAAREHRIRRQVLETIQKMREKEAVARATDEIAYLQRRVIALLQRLQEKTDENALLKEVMVAQAYSLSRLPFLEQEIKRLEEMEFDREKSRLEQQGLLDAAAKLKIDRDFLDELLRASEDENCRLARILADTRAELDRLQCRRWWHIFWPPRTA